MSELKVEKVKQLLDLNFDKKQTKEELIKSLQQEIDKFPETTVFTSFKAIGIGILSTSYSYSYSCGIDTV